MSAGDWHDIGDLHFQETLMGPFLGAECIDCGEFCCAVPDYPSPRCERCMQRAYRVPPPHVRMTGAIRPSRWLNPVGFGYAEAPVFDMESYE